MQGTNMVIDSHCHAGLGDGLQGPWDTRADLGDYLRRCDAAGIARSVVFAALQSDYRAGNAQDVDFIIPHLGSFADDWKAQLAIIDHLVRHPNVYANTAGARRFDLLVEAVRRAGPHKILFGSDGPWLHPSVELAKVQLLGLPRAEYERIAGGTLIHLLRKRRDHELRTLAARA